MTKDDPDWKVLAAWVNGATLASYTNTARVARIIQTNAAGDNIHLIDPATNKVVEVINDIEVPHGVTSAPDGTRMYFTNEALHTLDAVDSTTLAVIARVHLSGRPNNVAISNDGKRVYVGIAQAPGAVDVIDTVTLTNAKSIRGQGRDPQRLRHARRQARRLGIDPRAHAHRDRPGDRDHCVGAADDRRRAADDVRYQARRLDQEHLHPAVGLPRLRGDRFRCDARKCGASTCPRSRAKRSTRPACRAPRRTGLGVTPDGKILFSTSKVYSTMYAYSLPNLEPIGHVHVGQHPEWVTFSPDGRHVYVAAAGDNSTTVVDVKTLKVVANIPVGQVPKRNGTASCGLTP